MVEVTIHPPSENDISRADATFHDVIEGAKEPAKPSFFQRTRRWTLPLLLLAGSTLLATACGSGVKAVEPNPNAVAISAATPTEVPPTATASPTPKPPTPEHTKVPPTPTVIPSTPTREATPIPKPENPLPKYGAFMGELLDKQLGGKGMIVLASIPEANTQDSILVYYNELRPEKSLGGKLVGDSLAFMAQVESIQQDGTFQAIKPTKGLWRIQATLDNTGKTLTGKIENGRPGIAPEWEATFQANLTGAGKTNVINSIKQAKVIGLKFSNVSDLSTINLDELKGSIDLANLPQ